MNLQEGNETALLAEVETGEAGGKVMVWAKEEVWMGRKKGGVCIRDMCSGREIAEVTDKSGEAFCRQNTHATAMLRHETSEVVWVGFNDGGMAVICAETYQCRHEWKPHTGTVHSITVSDGPDPTFYTSGEDRQIRSFTGFPPKCTATYTQHHAPVLSLLHTPTGLFSGSSDGYLYHWASSSPATHKAHANGCLILAAHPRNPLELWSGGGDGGICIWAHEGGKPLKMTKQLQQHPGPVTTLLQVANKMISMDKHGVVVVWDGYEAVQRISPEGAGGWQRHGISAGCLVGRVVSWRFWTTGGDGRIKVWGCPAESEAQMVSDLMTWNSELQAANTNLETAVAALQVRADHVAEVTESNANIEATMHSAITSLKNVHEAQLKEASKHHLLELEKLRNMHFAHTKGLSSKHTKEVAAIRAEVASIEAAKIEMMERYEEDTQQKEEEMQDALKRESVSLKGLTKQCEAEATELTRTYTAEIEGIQHKCSEEVRGLTEELEREQERCRKLEQQVEESTEYVKEVRERQAELAEIVKGMPAVKALEEKVVALEEELKTVLDVPAPLVASLQTEIETLQTALAEKERELSRPVPTIPVAAPPAPDLVCSLQAEVALLQTRLMEKERDHASRPVAIHIPKPAPVTPYAVPNVHTPRAHQQVLDAVERYRSEVQKLGDEVSVGKKHESLSRQVDSNNTVIAHLEAQLDAALRTSGELEGKASGLEMALSNAQAQLMAAKADQEHAVGTLRGVEASLEKALHEKQLVEMQNRTLEDRMQVRIEEAEVLQGHLALSQRTLCEKQQQFEAEKNEYLKCTDRLQEVVETVGTERDVLGKLVGTLEGELKEERRMADENGTRWVESETSLKVLKYEKEEMLLKTQEADYAMTQLTSANAAIQDELSAMRDSLAEVCESESHLKTRIISLLEERDASLQDLDSLKLAYNDLEREAPVIAPPNTLASELSNITSSSPWILSQLKSLQDGLDQTHLTREELQAKTAYLVDLIAMAVS